MIYTKLQPFDPSMFLHMLGYPDTQPIYDPIVSRYVSLSLWVPKCTVSWFQLSSIYPLVAILCRLHSQHSHPTTAHQDCENLPSWNAFMHRRKMAHPLQNNVFPKPSPSRHSHAVFAPTHLLLSHPFYSHRTFHPRTVAGSNIMMKLSFLTSILELKGN